MTKEFASPGLAQKEAEQVGSLSPSWRQQLSSRVLVHAIQGWASLSKQVLYGPLLNAAGNSLGLVNHCC